MSDDWKWSAPLCYGDDALDEVAELRRKLATVDQLLENDFGGFYLSAPDNVPLGQVRRILRDETDTSTDTSPGELDGDGEKE
jgi:hypothetical protein